jgi:hypothetical protein
MKLPKKPWKKTIRRENGLIEHICKHGCGHPATGSVGWAALCGVKGAGVHGCDGCCGDMAWRLADLEEGLKKAHELLFKACKLNRGDVE